MHSTAPHGSTVTDAANSADHFSLCVASHDDSPHASTLPTMSGRRLLMAVAAALLIAVTIIAKVHAASQSHTMHTRTRTRTRARKRMGQDDAHHRSGTPTQGQSSPRDPVAHMCTHTFIASLRFVFALRVCVAHGSELLRYRSALGHFAANGLITCNCAPFQSRYVILNGYTLTRM